MSIIFDKIKETYWNNSFMSPDNKEKLFYYVRKKVRGSISATSDNNVLSQYAESILNIQMQSPEFEVLSDKTYDGKYQEAKIIAYYLPQFYPTPYNDEWWGKGTTEWRNVAKAMPQYVGHYQPRLPGELGFYDLRLTENIERQVELAKNAGVYGFCFYFYWFDGKRLLDLPVDKFFEEKIDFPFCFCWANENWSKQWFGTSEEPLITQSKTVESYKEFIASVAKYMIDDRYMTINGKKVLNIYRPKAIPECRKVIEYWRNYIKEHTGYELYLIAAMNDTYEEYEKIDFIANGFDAMNEFCLGPQRSLFKDIRASKGFVCKEFLGNIYDYKEFVENQKYLVNKLPRTYRAISPMWDNSARKVNKGIVLDGATPKLYEKWLTDIISETNERVSKGELDDNIIFVNAWNEWSEGAYLEPDLKFGYGYLNATFSAIQNYKDK